MTLQFTSCLYCLLLVLIMWALNAAPKPIIAVLHVVNLPMMNLMSAEELAAQYLTLDALLLVILLYLVVLVDSLSDLVKRIAYTVCSRYGLRRSGVFLSLCCATFFAAMIISTVVLCVPLLYVVDRVFSIIYKEDMDQQLTSDSQCSRRNSASVSNVATPGKRDVDNLFEKLAVYAHSLPKRSSADQVSLAVQIKQQKQQEKKKQQPPQQPESSPDGAPRGEPSGADQPGAAAASGTDGSARVKTVASANEAPAAPKENGLSAQPTSHVNDTSCVQAETKAPSAATEDNPPNGAGAEPNPGKSNEHNGEANDKHHAAGGAHKHRANTDDKRAVASDDDGANENVAVTKHGGKKGGHHGGHSKHGGKDDAKGAGKEPGSHLVSRRKSKKVGGRHNVVNHDKTGAPTQADECQSPEAGMISPMTPETAPNGEAQLSPEAAPSPGGIVNPDPEASALVAPGGSGRPQDHSEAFESRRHGKKGFKGHKGHKKEAHHKSGVAKRVAEVAGGPQTVEAADDPKAPGASSTFVVPCKHDTDVLGISKTSPQDGAGVANPTVIGSTSSVKSPSSETPLEAASDPSAVASPTGPTPGDQQTKALAEKTTGAAEKRALVVKDNPVILRAANEAPNARKDGSPDEQSLTPAEAPAPSQMQRRASILRQPGTMPRFGPAPGRGSLTRRRTSVVDFGADKYAAYVPGDVVTKPRILSDTSASNQSAVSVLAAPDHRPGAAKTISLRKTWREESRGARPSAAQAAINEEFLKRKRQTSEPEDTNTEHSAAVQTAFTKLKSLGTPSLAGALVVHCSVLVLVMCVPAGYIGSDIRLTLLSLLTWTALLVSASGSLAAKTWPVVRSTWSRVPWGVIFIIGSVQVASKVVEDYGLLTQLFKSFKPTFWTARSHIEVQAILATISSVLAETTNNQTLSLLMLPIVQDIAESKNMYPMYYAIPVVVGASSNVIMPISVPMVVMHEIGRVPFVRLVPAQDAAARMIVCDRGRSWKEGEEERKQAEAFDRAALLCGCRRERRPIPSSA
ncbi:hypothetical protein V5799_010605 [Amblyomma americanum]|uniref:Citrate transporter-like domain-containing protein n=1 Tax=Amblyomma americanum TaxID=6943 RepID=A0AAQ4EJQ4_AMBAM